MKLGAKLGLVLLLKTSQGKVLLKEFFFYKTLDKFH